MKYDKMLKKVLVSLLQTRDKALAHERKMTAEATAPLVEKIEQLKNQQLSDHRDRPVQSEERDAIRKEHFTLTQRIVRQDAQIERLVIERSRAREKTQEVARLVSIYRRVLADVLGDPEILVAPSLAATPREQVQVHIEHPECPSSGVFSDQVLKDRNKTAFGEVGE